MGPFLFDPTDVSDWEDLWQRRNEAVTEVVVAIAVIIAAVIVTRWLVRRILRRVLAGLVERAEARKPARDPEAIARRAETLRKTLAWVFDIIIFSIGFGLIVGELGFNVTALVAGFGIVGVAIGFGAQTFVKDVINGFFILAEDQYRIGDVVRVGNVDGSGTVGVVEDINPRRTMLRDLDGTVHFIPNSAVVVASNMTLGYSRINMNVSVAYKEDLDRVIEVINDVCDELQTAYPAAVREAPRVLRVDGFGESSVDIKVYGDVRMGEQWMLMGELRHRLKNRFDAEGIEIPFPHRVVFHRDVEPPVEVVTAEEAGGD